MCVQKGEEGRGRGEREEGERGKEGGRGGFCIKEPVNIRKKKNEADLKNQGPGEGRGRGTFAERMQ